MAVTHEGDLHVNGPVYIGSMAMGKAKLESQPNEPVSIEVRDFNLEKSTIVVPMLTALTMFPGSGVLELGFRTATGNSVDLYGYRTTDYPMVIQWLMWRT